MKSDIMEIRRVFNFLKGIKDDMGLELYDAIHVLTHVIMAIIYIRYDEADTMLNYIPNIDQIDELYLYKNCFLDDMHDSIGFEFKHERYPDKPSYEIMNKEFGYKFNVDYIDEENNILNIEFSHNNRSKEKNIIAICEKDFLCSLVIICKAIEIFIIQDMRKGTDISCIDKRVNDYVEDTNSIVYKNIKVSSSKYLEYLDAFGTDIVRYKLGPEEKEMTNIDRYAGFISEVLSNEPVIVNGNVSCYRLGPLPNEVMNHLKVAISECNSNNEYISKVTVNSDDSNVQFPILIAKTRDGRYSRPLDGTEHEKIVRDYMENGLSNIGIHDDLIIGVEESLEHYDDETSVEISDNFKDESETKVLCPGEYGENNADVKRTSNEIAFDLTYQISNSFALAVQKAYEEFGLDNKDQKDITNILTEMDKCIYRKYYTEHNLEPYSNPNFFNDLFTPRGFLSLSIMFAIVNEKKNVLEFVMIFYNPDDEEWQWRRITDKWNNSSASVKNALKNRGLSSSFNLGLILFFRNYRVDLDITKLQDVYLKSKDFSNEEIYDMTKLVVKSLLAGMSLFRIKRLNYHLRNNIPQKGITSKFSEETFSITELLDDAVNAVKDGLLTKKDIKNIMKMFNMKKRNEMVYDYNLNCDLTVDFFENLQGFVNADCIYFKKNDRIICTESPFVISKNNTPIITIEDVGDKSKEDVYNQMMNVFKYIDKTRLDKLI